MLITLTGGPQKIVDSGRCKKEVMVCLVSLAIANEILIQQEANGSAIACLFPTGTTCITFDIIAGEQLYADPRGGTGEITVWEKEIC